VRERIVVRWELESPATGPSRARLRRLMMMRRIALTLAFLAIAAVAALVLTVVFTAQNS
jgi:uncharacterized membrane protein YqjE